MCPKSDINGLGNMESKTICKSFTILHQNCGSIRNKLLALDGIIEMYKPNILVITETWLNKSEVDNIRIKCYTHVSHFVRKRRTVTGINI